MKRANHRASALFVATGKLSEDGQECWCAHGSDSFVRGFVVGDSGGDTVTVNLGQPTSPIQMARSDTYPVNPKSQDGVADNTELMYLREPHMLHNLRCRFERNEIYTYTVRTCVIRAVRA